MDKPSQPAAPLRQQAISQQLNRSQPGQVGQASVERQNHVGQLLAQLLKVDKARLAQDKAEPAP